MNRCEARGARRREFDPCAVILSAAKDLRSFLFTGSRRTAEMLRFAQHDSQS